jgi:2-oxo-4-hydroxy-4-carboxy-5-ureidoimidazoline decarboxylase
MIALADVNALDLHAFVARFADVAEHSPWVAETAFVCRPFPSREALVQSFESALRMADRDRQLALIRAHPDLATRAQLTRDSTNEQKGAGLDTLTPAEFARFTELNGAYRKRFGFPFIFAVKGATKHQILASFEERVGRSESDEFDMALSHICRIFRFRIEDRVSS